MGREGQSRSEISDSAVDEEGGAGRPVRRWWLRRWCSGPGRHEIRRRALGFQRGANYRHKLTSNWDLGLAGAAYCHARPPRPNNDPFAPGGEGYCQVNASLRVYQEHGPWELAVIATNLGDVRYVAPANTGKPLGAPGDLESVVGPPREVTLQATDRF